jgi:1-deoxy-D-xylulose-5-phosphate reductoisomerase
MAASATHPRRLILLGSTGSIGVNTLSVVQHLHDLGSHRFEIVGLAAGSNAQRVLEQARAFSVSHVAIADPAASPPLRSIKHLYTGPDAPEQLIRDIARPGDLIVGAMVGSAGVPATIAAIERGCDIALANKETLVAAGEIVMPLVKQRGVTLLPIDSEHSAIFQCLAAGRNINEVARLVITASGGPFRASSREQLEHATVEQALAHPTWNMGPKITIDSASLMNKALEVIEAHWLFGLDAPRIQTIIHPQSLIHSFVEFIDGSVIAQLGPPDMRTPIQYALTWPHRVTGCSKRMNWADLRRMDFEPVDHKRFPAIKLAERVIEQGGTAGSIFNAANEAAVNAFINHRIPFTDITRLVHKAIESLDSRPVHSLADVMNADALAREFVSAEVEASSRAFARS